MRHPRERHRPDKSVAAQVEGGKCRQARKLSWEGARQAQPAQ